MLYFHTVTEEVVNRFFITIGQRLCREKNHKHYSGRLALIVKERHTHTHTDLHEMFNS